MGLGLSNWTCRAYFTLIDVEVFCLTEAKLGSNTLTIEIGYLMMLTLVNFKKIRLSTIKESFCIKH